MIHLLRRFLPLVLGAWGGLLGSLTGWLVHQLASRSLDYLWQPWLGWRWVLGILVYPAVGFVLAIPFVYVYPGRPQPLDTDRGRVVELHVRAWLAVFATLYLPVGIGFAYHHWWGAPTIPLPFTDVSLYPGAGGDLVATMIAVSILGPFCGAGIERLLRGTPVLLRVALGPPLALALTLGGVFAAVLVSGSIAAQNMGVTSAADVTLFGPLLQPMGTAGWDTGTVVALVTVVAGCLGGALCTLTTAMPALSGMADLHPRGSRRRWLLPLTAVAVSGALSLLALLQGFGIDSFRPLYPVVRPGQPAVVGNLVAPSDHDTLRFEPGGTGLYLLEFPRPGPHQRHMVNIGGQPLPSGRDDTMRYLIDTDDHGTTFEISVQPVWPLRTGVSSYTGPLRFEAIERTTISAADAAAAPQRLQIDPGRLREWKLQLKGQPVELVLDAGTAATWTIMAPSLQYDAGWAYTTGRSAVMLDVLAQGRSLCKATLDAESYTYLGLNLAVGAVQPTIPDGELRLRLVPSAHPDATIDLAVVAEGLAPGTLAVHPGSGASLVPTRVGTPVVVRPEPGGTVTTAAAVSLGDGDVSLVRLRDDGSPTPGEGEVLLMGETHFVVEGGSPGEPAVVVLGAGAAQQPWNGSWGMAPVFYR